jgi:hypothetical protein
MGDPTLGDFLAQASRGMGGGYMNQAAGPLPGYMFGPDFFKKGTYLQISDTFNYTYGKKSWDALNNRTVAFNAIKKVDWGPTVGWRLRTARGSQGRSGPVTEGGNLPTMTNSTYVGVYGYPKTVVSTFGVTIQGQAVNALEGGIGNQFAVEQEGTSRDHIKEINLELMAGSAYRMASGSSTGCVIGSSATAGYTMVDSFRIGDVVQAYGYTGAAATITGTSDTAGTVSWSGGGITGSSSLALYIYSRAGLTSIDDVCMDTASTPGGVTAGYAPSNIYNLTTRTAGTYLGPAVQNGYNAGVGRDLTLALVDNAITSVRQNGGEPKLIITGLDTYDKMNQLLQTQQRFMDVSDYIVGVGDERTYPGTRAGFQLSTYRGVPILPDPDTAKSLSSTPAVLASNLYVLDTDYMEIAVMYPTQYVENRDYFSAGKLVLRGMFVTMMEMRCLRPDVQAAVKDINT